jgi:hypothetical protein
MRVLRFLIGFLILLSIGILIGIGYIWRNLAFLPSDVRVAEPTASTSSNVVIYTTTTPPTKGSASSSPSHQVLTEPITVTVRDLPPAQQTILKTLGMDDAAFTITPEAVQCMVEAFGETRAYEIQHGATPSMSEALAFMACLK